MNAVAQTTLSQGDIAFLGFKVSTNSNDGHFTLLVRKTIEPGTVIRLTNMFYNNGALSSTPVGSSASYELKHATIEVTFNERVSFGKSFVVDFSTTSGLTTVSTSLGNATFIPAVTGSIFDFGSTDADSQCHLYQVNGGSPTILGVLIYGYSGSNSYSTYNSTWTNFSSNSIDLDANGKSVKCASYYPYPYTKSGNNVTFSTTPLSTLDLNESLSNSIYKADSWVTATTNGFSPCDLNQVLTVVVAKIAQIANFSLIYSYGKKRSISPTLVANTWFVKDGAAQWAQQSSNFDPWTDPQHASRTGEGVFYFYDEFTAGSFTPAAPNPQTFKVGKIILVDTSITTVANFSKPNFILPPGNILDPQISMSVQSTTDPYSSPPSYKLSSDTSTVQSTLSPKEKAKMYYAQIAPTNATMSGTVEYSLLINKPGWHHIHSPISTQWGNVTDDNPNWALFSGVSNIYWYDAANSSAVFWTPAIASDDASDKPYIVYFSPDANGSGQYEWPTRLTFKGSLAFTDTDLETQNNAIHSSATSIGSTPGYNAPWYTSDKNGWNFEGNHTLSWLDVESIKTNYNSRMTDLTMGIYLWDPFITTSRTTNAQRIGNSNYSNYYYHNGSSGSVSGLDPNGFQPISSGDDEARYIPPFGAFFMKKHSSTVNGSALGFVQGRKALTSGNLTTNSMKTGQKYLALQLSIGQDALNYVYISPNPEVKSKSINAKYDMATSDGLLNTISLLKDSAVFRIKSVPLEFDSLSIKVCFVSEDVTTQFSISNHPEFSENHVSYLIDFKENKVHDLSVSPYYFLNDPNFRSDRFEWIIMPQSVSLPETKYNDQNIGVYWRNGVLYSISDNTYAEFLVFDLNGKEVFKSSYSNGYILDGDLIPSGTYFIRFDNMIPVKFVKP